MLTKTRTTVAGALIAGIATIGTGGVAAAASTPPTSPKPATTVAPKDREFCEKWVPRLPGLQDRVQKDEQRIDELNRAIEYARDHHREDMAERLERVRDGVQHDRDGLIVLVATIHFRCGS